MKCSHVNEWRESTLFVGKPFTDAGLAITMQWGGARESLDLVSSITLQKGGYDGGFNT